jgi:hypothetical protein
MESTLRIRIEVRGRLTQRLAQAFDGLALMPRTGATELAGVVVDQAQLHGLLTRIRDLGLDLQSVTVLDTSAESPCARSVVSRDLSASKPCCPAPNMAGK